jgi:AcrR family transcriptional regulator
LNALQTRSARLAKSLAAAGLGARQAAIVEALDRCMQQKGYAHTSLNDVASAAGMSPSHLLYYFSGKQSILEMYFRAAEATILTEITAHAHDRPEARIDHVASFFFGGWIRSRGDQRTALELFTQAVHHAPLRQIRSRFDRRMKAYLADIFRQCPRLISAKADDAAQEAYGLLLGLVATSYFDERLTLARARSLFRAGVRRLAGLPPERRARRKGVRGPS